MQTIAMPINFPQPSRRGRKSGDGVCQRATHLEGGRFRREGDSLEYSQEEVDFMMAMERYKRENRRINPTFAEVLAVARSLGYRKDQP